MATGKQIAAVLIAVTIAAAVFTPITDAISGNSGDVEVTGETVTAELGSAVALDGYSLEEDSETVERFNSTSDSYESVTSGTDYEINYDQGTITALEGGAIEEGDTLRVGYTYEATDTATTAIVILIPMFLALLMLGVLAEPIMDGL